MATHITMSATNAYLQLRQRRPYATVQLRSMHAALHAAEKTPRDPLEIEELWDQAHEQWNQAV